MFTNKTTFPAGNTFLLLRFNDKTVNVVIFERDPLQFHRPDAGDHGGAVRPAESPASRPASCACALVHLHPFHTWSRGPSGGSADSRPRKRRPRRRALLKPGGSPTRRPHEQQTQTRGVSGHNAEAGCSLPHVPPGNPCNRRWPGSQSHLFPAATLRSRLLTTQILPLRDSDKTQTARPKLRSLAAYSSDSPGCSRSAGGLLARVRTADATFGISC